MRRALLVLITAIVGIGVFTGGLAWLLTDPRPPAGAAYGERLYYRYCVEGHGRDGLEVVQHAEHPEKSAARGAHEVVVVPGL